METILLIIHVLVAMALIGLVLMQQGKGADMGAGFGSGASGTVFGASGSGSFMSRLTGGVAAAFFIMTIVLAIVSSQTAENKDVISDALDEPAVVETVKADADEAPAAPAEETATIKEGEAAANLEDIKPEAEQFEEKVEAATEEAATEEAATEEAATEEVAAEVKEAATEAAEKVEEKVEQAEETVTETVETAKEESAQ